jgi:branched-chain amino acid transport system substrate-binding protein
MFHGVKLVSALLMVSVGVGTTSSRAADAPGVTPTEIKIGGVFPFSGPASSIGVIGRSTLAYVQSINDHGGIQGRKINYIAFRPARLRER